MRQGLIRDASYLAAYDVQLGALHAIGCDSVARIDGNSMVADRRAQRLLLALEEGDSLVLQDLGALQSPKRNLPQMLRNLLETGVTIFVTPTPGVVHTLQPSDELILVLGLLADQERPRMTGGKAVYQGGSRNPLSKFQIDYARRRYAEGETLRNIGLLFQRAPIEIAEVVSPARTMRESGQIALD